ncbi:F0F1 ATP synthase subunit A [Actinorugispora endophytica]|uniref:ATP synthase subunit a n=1 Tax=Actinorugispora endophytica TaxID=1605990 RepID=A0A4R6UMK0_9ACTN|nr:F0F1 ATP synthase subunit A [Actinorugispora endophytica]TDQ47962.1 ATP synthase F0 subcomplex A subunit [Actinorugispora endophytica]
MSADTLNLAAEGGGGLFTPGGPGFEAPSVGIFFPEAWSWGDYGAGSPYLGGITKYAVLLLVATALTLLFLWWTTRKQTKVPGRSQSIGEIFFLFIRTQISRPMMGVKGDKYLPLLISLFLFIFAMNIMGIIPFLQLPVPSNLSYPVGLALIVYITFIVVGIRAHGGVGKYLKSAVVPSGAPWWILPLLVPIEVISNFMIRPATHAIRVFATMFAGHLLLATFAAGGWYMFNPSAGPVFGTISVLFSGASLLAFILFTAFELVIMFLQAFVFTLLAALYIGEAQEAH